MTPNDLRAFPDSPIVTIQSQSDARISTTKQSPFDGFFGRIGTASAPAEAPRGGGFEGRARSTDLDDADVAVGLPVQLPSPGRGLPPPLVWVSPASLARSPMVRLRRLDNDIRVEHALTMNFPAKTGHRFTDSKCARCLKRRRKLSQTVNCSAICGLRLRR
jgi:hypothetical protein